MQCGNCCIDFLRFPVADIKQAFYTAGLAEVLEAKKKAKEEATNRAELERTTEEFGLRPPKKKGFDAIIEANRRANEEMRNIKGEPGLGFFVDGKKEGENID